MVVYFSHTGNTRTIAGYIHETVKSDLVEIKTVDTYTDDYDTLLEQIRKFGAGERKDPFMQGLIKVLKDEERLQLALFYAAQPVPPAKADAGQAAKGKDVFAKLCARCHGEQARGNDLYPRLAGQNLAYLQTSITHYRDGTGIRSNQLMAIATAPLKNGDVVALSHYLAQLP